MRAKLKRGYHDAKIRSVRYREPDEVRLDVDLCSCRNEGGPGVGTLWFRGVKNFSEVQAKLERSRSLNQAKWYIDEIVGILRESGAYILDLDTAGAVQLRGATIIET